MKRIVINACGLKSKGGITVFKKLIKNNTDVKFYIVYDNFELKQLVGNNESIFIKTPRYLQPFLNYFIKRDDLKFINNFDEIIHLGNFGFKTKIKTSTFVQNVLPIVKPFASFRNFILKILYIYSFKISDEIIVQQSHVANLLPESTKIKTIGKVIYKNVPQSKNQGFVLIYENIRNKNPKFIIKFLSELVKLGQNINIVNVSRTKELSFLNHSNFKNIVVHNKVDNNKLIDIFKNNSHYIHTSKYETVGLPIYEALESGMKVIVPNEEYINIDNDNIFKYVLGDVDSLIKTCNLALVSKSLFEANVPIYYEDWNLI
jgi:hypothetical protein